MVSATSGARPLKQLIVNADDYGYTPGVNRAIREAYRSGMVTSTSLLANGPAFEEAAEQARQEPGLDVGCHLNFVEGAPVSASRKIPHLVGADGFFISARTMAWRLIRNAVPAEELEREARAQIEKLLGAGIRPTHLDTHQHTHLHPRVTRVVARVAREFQIGWVRRPFENCTPSRLKGTGLRRVIAMLCNPLAPGFDRTVAAQGLRTPDFFTGFSLTGRLTRTALEATLAALPPGLTELMCHPGYCDDALAALPTRLKQEREIEREAVADGAWRSHLANRGVVLTRFSRAARKPLPAAEEPLLAVSDPAGRR